MGPATGRNSSRTDQDRRSDGAIPQRCRDGPPAQRGHSSQVSADVQASREVVAKKGYLYLKQLDLNALREFRESWELGPRTAMKKLERVKAFFRFASENEWVAVNPARLLRGPANIRDTQKLPFEPAEIERIFKACREVQIQGCSNDELLAFTLILRYSGLRIGDASMLTVDRFKGDDLYLYTQKSGTHVFVPLPPPASAQALNGFMSLPARHYGPRSA